MEQPTNNTASVLKERSLDLGLPHGISKGAVFQSRFLYDALSETEEQFFPDITNGAPEVLKAFLKIRNRLLKYWLGDPKTELPVDLALKKLKKSTLNFDVGLIKRVHGFLERNGYINFGLFKQTRPSLKNNFKIIIIGAGMSGLAAARQLQFFGFQVIVLEGRDRVGGRINTLERADGFADIGAMVITGLAGNPLRVLAQQTNARLRAIRMGVCPLYVALSDKGEFDHFAKSVEKTVDKKVEKAYNVLLDDIKNESDTANDIDDESMSFGHAIDWALMCAPEFQSFSARERAIFDWHLANLEFSNGTSLDNLSLLHWNQDDKSFFKGSHCTIEGGYSHIPKTLATDLDIKFNMAVRDVRYGPRGVQIVAFPVDDSMGGSKSMIFEGDAVLCTVPLGILKEAVKRDVAQVDRPISFNPPLPPEKVAAIERLGYGNLNKVVLFFDHVFWDPSNDFFGHILNGRRNRGEFFLFWNLHSLHNIPALMALVAGFAADALEAVVDEALILGSVGILKKIFGEENVPEPKDTVITHWGRDPWAKGTYSNVAVEATGQDYDIIAESIRPVDLITPCSSLPDTEEGRLMTIPRVFFAGEHTNRIFPATVHGAYVSGLREAGHIADSFLGRPCSP